MMEEFVADEYRLFFIRLQMLLVSFPTLKWYISYRGALEEREADRILYLAIPESVYGDFFQRPFIQKMIRVQNVKLIIYDLKLKAVTQWIK